MEQVGWWRSARSGVVLGALIAVGCVGALEEPRFMPGAEGGGPHGPGGVVCDDDKIVARPDELLRLTVPQYENAIRDLVGVDIAVAGFSDSSSGTFAANGTSDTIARGHVKSYLDAAEAAARAMDLSAYGVGCGDRSCVEAFVRSTGRRAYRQPLSDASVATLMGVYDDGIADGWTHDEAARGVVMALLMSPRLVYRWNETMADADAEPTLLDPHGLASRMAFFLWNSVPDDALLDAAAAGDLADPAGIEAQARRMIQSDLVRRSVRSFHGQWVHLESSRADDKRDPAFDPTLAASMRESSYLFVEEAMLNGGGLRELLTAPYAFVDSEVAPLLGATVPSDGQFHRVELDPSERAGILTQPRVLAALARFDKVSWVSRGQWVRERVLCEHISPPPANVDMTVLNNPERTTPGSACASCHLPMDPIGRGMDEYDELGRLRTHYADGTLIDEVIDVQGYGGFSEHGTFEHAPDLMRSLADEPQVQRCYAQQWYEMAVGPVRDEDACAVDTIADRFIESDLDLRELMVAVVTSEPFRYRLPTSEVSP